MPKIKGSRVTHSVKEMLMHAKQAECKTFCSQRSRNLLAGSIKLISFTIKFSGNWDKRQAGETPASVVRKPKLDNYNVQKSHSHGERHHIHRAVADRHMQHEPLAKEYRNEEASSSFWYCDWFYFFSGRWGFRSYSHIPILLCNSSVNGKETCKEFPT